jgi:hypothetical protein
MVNIEAVSLNTPHYWLLKFVYHMNLPIDNVRIVHSDGKLMESLSGNLLIYK